ncbi:c-type cytochrome [Ilyomonas limi]|uniref:C-type cytochrome n=1 Tax=Ilyomonas limi TaxID=2575867 RepID=A0A4U3LAM6_9BACT|nr:cbb3-type cytochrome c oxidase N-terminal domain-containing protein [Ilyomonas limi]TKK71749.1 c-type cytochrome [Ilyomonas limi]
MKFIYKKRWTKAVMLMSALLLSVNVFAEGKSEPSQMDNPLALVLVIIAGALLLAIGVLAYVLISVAGLYLEHTKEKEVPKATGTALKTLAVVAFCLVSSSLLAQDAAAAPAAAQQVVSTTISGLPKSSFYTLISVIGLEIMVILVMAYFVKVFTAKEKVITEAVTSEATHTSNIFTKIKKVWGRLNNFRPQSEEQEITLHHSYDGIQELDNRLPRWWIMGFYCTIIFACIYLYRYHIAHTAPSSIEEYQIAMTQAEAQKAAYLKHAANNIDENTVTLITDAPAVEEGQRLFTSSCSPCHGDKGQGVVGPNLTDDYWLHGGSINDVFKTIKYGYPEKGMKSWKDDFSPTQIARITSYIKSLHGSNPANAKEPQGELFKDNGAPEKDSVNLSVKKDVKAAEGKETALKF